MKYKYVLVFLLYYATSCDSQQPFGIQHLQLEKTIAMPQVSGRIDHLAINTKDMLVYVAALGNNTVEVIDINNGRVIHRITGLDEPQGICYLPNQNELVVANGGSGACVFYNASTYAIVATLRLGEDADNVRYDDRNGKMYVGYGNGAIAIIDAATHRQVGNIKLPAHPESLQIDQQNNLLFVNVPDDGSIAVIDTRRMQLTSTWKLNGLKENFPMTLDTANNSVIIGFRRPALLVSYDETTGREQNRTVLVNDVDDMFYDASKGEVFASGGGGAVNIFKRDNKTSFKKLADIPTRSGARTSLLIPSLQTFIVAERAADNKGAALAVYKIND